jgi:hypothetical protein
MGAMPCLKARTARSSRFWWLQRAAAKVSVVLGSKMPTMAIATPAIASTQACGPAWMPPPAFSPTFQPSTAMNSRFGPGAAWASAHRGGELPIAQPRFFAHQGSGAWPGRWLMAPPIASSDSDRKCANSASQSAPVSTVLMAALFCAAMGVDAAQFPIGPGAAKAAQHQQHPHQGHVPDGNGHQAEQRQQRAHGLAHGVVAQCADKLEATGCNQPCRHGTHAAQGALDHRRVGHTAQHRSQGQHDHQRKRSTCPPARTGLRPCQSSGRQSSATG